MVGAGENGANPHAPSPLEKSKKQNQKNGAKTQAPCPTQTQVSTSPEKIVAFLQQLVNCFELKDININDLYELVITNCTLELKRISDRKEVCAILHNEMSNDLSIKLNYVEYKYVNKWEQYKWVKPYI